MVIYIDDKRMIVGRRKDWYLSLSFEDDVLTIRTPPPETGERLTRNPLLVLGSDLVELVRMLFTDSRSLESSTGYNAITREIDVSLPFSGNTSKQRFTIAYEDGALHSFIFNLTLEYRHKGGITRTMSVALVVDTQQTIEAIIKLLTKNN